MTIAQEIGRLNREQEVTQGAREFAAVARLLTLHKGNLDLAFRDAERSRALPRIQDSLKAATTAGTTTGATWAQPLAPYAQVADAFLASLRNFGCFDRALPFMKNIPPHTTAAVVSVGASAASVREGQLKPISRLTLGSNQLDVFKSVAILVVSDMLLRMSGAMANNLFRQELSNAVN